MSVHRCAMCKGDGVIPDGPPVRIDTLRNRLAASLALVAEVAEELNDLHVLAYERPRAGTEEKVNHSRGDHALDNHGDPRARAAFRHLNAVTLEVSDMLALAAHEAVVLLRAGDERTPHTHRTIQHAELAERIAKQADRIKAGEYTPFRRLPQPDSLDAINAAQRSTEEARREYKSMRRLARWLSEYRDEPERKMPHDLQAITGTLYPPKKQNGAA